LKKWLLALLVVAAVVGWGVLRKTAPPKVSFTRVKRTTLTSTLPTNGKVEPFEWQAIRAERAGILSRVSVREGETVAKDQAIASISDPSLQADLQGGEARVAEARANLSALEAGGKPAELADIESSLKQAQLQLQQQHKDFDALQRLAQKQAATTVEVDAARQKIKQSETEIQGLEQRRSALVGKADLAAARARLQDAQAAYDLARDRAARSVVRAPMAGVIWWRTSESWTVCASACMWTSRSWVAWRRANRSRSPGRRCRVNSGAEVWSASPLRSSHSAPGRWAK
jgi:multidrug efflux pump subunit AcrA (membrane-fusion protein)